MVQERVQFTLAAKNDLSLSTESKEFEDVKTFFSQISSENPPKKPTAPDYSSRQGEIDGAIWSNKVSRMGLVPVSPFGIISNQKFRFVGSAHNQAT